MEISRLDHKRVHIHFSSNRKFKRYRDNGCSSESYVTYLDYSLYYINNIKLKIMTKNDIYEQIVTQFNILVGENNGSTKASQARARKAAGEIKKLITPYR